jgi:hypothetical protein
MCITLVWTPRRDGAQQAPKLQRSEAPLARQAVSQGSPFGSIRDAAVGRIELLNAQDVPLQSSHLFRLPVFRPNITRALGPDTQRITAAWELDNA